MGLLLATIAARFRPMNMVISLLIVAIVASWGNLPKRGPQAPIDPIEAAKEARDWELARSDAGRRYCGGPPLLRYAVERLEAQTGRIATPHEVGIAAGMVTKYLQ